jgi:hypothetical protein
LSRPIRFGKSLTVSTLEAIFQGKKELFKGLAIEKHLAEEKFAPRPVVRLDMTDLTMSEGVEVFKDSLRRITSKIAKKLGLKVDSNIQPGGDSTNTYYKIGHKKEFWPPCGGSHR